MKGCLVVLSGILRGNYIILEGPLFILVAWSSWSLPQRVMKLCCMSRHQSLIMHACILAYSCSYCNIVIYILHAVSTLQAIGDGGQGWGNCILYTLLSSEIRKKLLQKMRRLFGCPDCCRDADHTNMTFSLNALLSSLMEGKVQQEFPIHLKPTTLCEQCVILQHFTLTIRVERPV